MNKSIILLIIAAFLVSTGATFADLSINAFGTGAYGLNHNVGDGAAETRVINATAKSWSDEGKPKPAEIVIKDTESQIVPASSLGGGENYMYEKGSDGYVYGYAEGGQQGVNETKTMYTDGIGRLHFFGKGSKIRE